MRYSDSMIVKGIDFTSSPSRRKPITCARAILVDAVLQVQQIEHWPDFTSFETEINAEGAWIAGMDFPFSLARRFIDNIGWPSTWSAYVEQVAQLTRDEFVSVLEAYKKDRQPGDKEHRRYIDTLANAISPQKLYGVPVGKMFYEGAKRLLASPASIPPLRPGESRCTIVEAYPALIARRCIGKASYKQDQKAKQTAEQQQHRQAIVAELASGLVQQVYGLRVELGELRSAVIEDASGDMLDAVLCSIQAAWAHSQREYQYGMPTGIDISEGWIADPMFTTPG